MDKSHDIDVTNTLIATTLDSVKGYRDAAERSDNMNHQQFFRHMADERSQVAADLQSHVRSIGGDPRTESSTAGSVHRSWLDLKDKVTGEDEEAIVSEVERGEDYIRDKFQAAMDDDKLGAATRGALEKCFASIRKGHDRASQMKRTLEHAD